MPVRTVQDRGDLDAFVDLPYRLHSDDPLWVPPLRREVRSLLSPCENPFFECGEAEYFLAERGGSVEGRIAAISNRLHAEIHDDGVGFFGYFECADDQRIADELFDAAATWVKSRGHTKLRGPVSPSVNQECGLLVDGFDTPPTFMMPHNPRYYRDLLERAGFGKAKDLWAYQGGDPRRQDVVPVPERSARAVALVGRRLGVTVRAIDMKNLSDEIGVVREIFNACWQDNWGFVPLTESEVRHMGKELRPLVVPDLVPMAEKDGRVVGFGLAIPDLNEVLIRNRSGGTLPGFARILWSQWRKRFRRIRILLLGVLPEYRGKGIDAMLWHWIWSRGLDHGIRWGEAGWILEDNPAMNNALERMSFSRYKTYRIYERPV